ncbi:MAG: uridine kinase [Maricaulaceae bacterium]|nr:uridine kinase [Maricaulaceae bacterium]
MTRPVLVAVCGGSASGKTQLAQAVTRALAPDPASLVSEDDYYGDWGGKPGFDASRFNFDDPAARDHALLAAHLDALRAGRPVDSPVYDFAIHRRTGRVRRVEPSGVVLVEGIHVLAAAPLRERFDLSIYVDAPADMRLARRLMRDMRERGRSAESVVAQYFGAVRPMHLRFTEPGRQAADLVIVNDADAAGEALQAHFDALAAPLAEKIRSLSRPAR